MIRSDSALCQQGRQLSAQLRRRRIGEPEALRPGHAGRFPGQRGPADGRRRRRAAAGLRDGAHEQALGRGAGDQHLHGDRTGALAEHRHPPGIAAEGRDVPLHPLQRRDLVHQPIVAQPPAVGVLRAQRRMGKVAQAAQAVVDRHHHDAAPGQSRAVVERHAAGTARERATVDEHHHRLAPRLRLHRPVDVEKQAVLADRTDLGPGLVPQVRLLAGRPERRRRPDAGPGRHRLRRAPAIGAAGGRGERDALEDQHIARPDALDDPGVEPRDRAGRRGGGRPGADRHSQSRAGKQHLQARHPTFSLVSPNHTPVRRAAASLSEVVSGATFLRRMGLLRPGSQ